MSTTLRTVLGLARQYFAAVSAQPGIVTPEAVVLDVERAGVASRILAMGLDLLALGFIYFVLLFAAVQLLGDLDGVAGAVVVIVTSLVVYLGWFCAFEAIMQRTPGKAAFGLRVVSFDGTPVRFVQAFLRVIIGLVDFFLIPFGFIAVVSTLVSRNDQRLGDLAAGTLVVRQRTAAGFVAPAVFPSPWGYEGYVASLDVGRMTTEQYGLVRTYLLRAHHLQPWARINMAVRLANPLSRVLHHDPPPGLHPETFLACVAAAWQRTHGMPRLYGAPPSYGAPTMYGANLPPSQGIYR
jgi:uncharacterized RDD family membrane protein YckC